MTDAQQRVFDCYAARFTSVEVTPHEGGALIFQGIGLLDPERKPAERLFVPASGMGARVYKPTTR